jgi:probable F420-dependent oxidoreductase
MREMVTAIRAIWSVWQEGGQLDHQGEFYRHTLMAPFFDPGPNPYGRAPIFLAGVGPMMTEVAGEVADGYFLHPFHTRGFVDETTRPALERGLARAGRTREDLQIVAQVIVASGGNEAALEEARRGARTQIAFYGSTPAYRGVLENAGRPDLHSALHALSREGRWAEMGDRIDDELLDQIAIVGPLDEIAPRLADRYGGVADRISLVGYGLSADEQAGLVPAIHAI